MYFGFDIFSAAELECELNSMKITIPDCMEHSEFDVGKYKFVFGDPANSTLCPLQLDTNNFDSATKNANVEFDKTSANDNW